MSSGERLERGDGFGRLSGLLQRDALLKLGIGGDRLIGVFLPHRLPSLGRLRKAFCIEIDPPQQINRRRRLLPGGIRGEQFIEGVCGGVGLAGFVTKLAEFEQASLRRRRIQRAGGE